MDSALKTWGKDIIELDGDRQAMLEGLRDYIYTIEGTIDITKIVQEYFKENGYEFDSDDEEDFDDEEW